MHIAHFKSSIWHQGGVSSYIKRTAIAQQEAGHTVTLFDPTVSDTDTEEGLTVVGRLSSADVIHRAQQRKVDILNIHESLENAPSSRVPVVYTLHNHDAYCPSGSQHLKTRDRPCHRVAGAGCVVGHLKDHCGSLRPANALRNIRKHLLHQRLVARIPVIAVSRFQKKQLIRAGYAPDRIFVVQSPVPCMNMAYTPPPPDGVPQLLFMGRVVPEKGLKWLLKAFSLIGVSAHLDVAGDGYALAEMKRLTDSLGLQDRVTFHGWVAQDRLQQLIRQSRAIVVPSTWHEPAGLVSLEAAAHGRPVIASRSGGIPEYVDASWGALVTPGDVQALAGHLTTFASDYERARSAGRIAFEAVHAGRTVPQFLSDLDEVYEQIITASGRKNINTADTYLNN